MAARAAVFLSALNALHVFLRLSAATANQNTTSDSINATVDHTPTYDAPYSSEGPTDPPPTHTHTHTQQPPRPGFPLPEAGRLPAPTPHVGSVCPCDKLKEVCDVNCCCDKECVEELAVFTHCSVSQISARRQLCSREVASYCLRWPAGADSFPELQASVTTERNPHFLCINTQNRVDALSHPWPAVPADSSFDSLFTWFSSSTATWQQGQGHGTREELRPTAAYQYGDVMMTAGAGGIRGSFWLPTSGITSDCVDLSPAGFLKEQSSSCYRPLVVEEDCGSLAALRMDTYTNVQLYSGKNQDAALVPVRLDSLLVRSLDGTLSRAQPGPDPDPDPGLLPVLVPPDRAQAALCANVVLKVAYAVTFSPEGGVRAAGVSLLLGFVDARQRRLQQEFQLTFVQEGSQDPAVPLSGRPGYVVGLPLLSGRKTAQGLVRSVEPSHTLSVPQGAAGEDCLAAPPPRSAVRFGLDSLSGCTLRVQQATNCSLLSQLILDVLRGPHPPQYVAAFGNSPLDNPADWLPIRTSSDLEESRSCRIPLSRHVEIEWTKYGSLVNPQAQIIGVREIIQTKATTLTALSSGAGRLSIASSVSFVAAAANARPAVRAMPTIDAKLPFDFFFPFV